MCNGTFRECRKMQHFHVGSHQFGESLRELLSELWPSYCSSRDMLFREWNFTFRKSLSELRELLREYHKTLRELREWPCHSKRVFLGWVDHHASDFGKGRRVKTQWAKASENIEEEKKGEAFLLTVAAFLLTVKLLCLQSLKALTRRTFPLSKKAPTVSKKAKTVSKKALIVSKEAKTVNCK